RSWFWHGNDVHRTDFHGGITTRFTNNNGWNPHVHSLFNRLGSTCRLYRSRWFRSLYFCWVEFVQAAFLLACAVPTHILALLTDYFLGKLEMKLTPKGIQKSDAA